jgi:hypothetical protein
MNPGDSAQTDDELLEFARQYGQTAEAAADAHLLFDRDGFREVARLVDVAALLERNMVGEQLKRDIEQQRIEFGRGRWHLESRIDRDRKAAARLRASLRLKLADAV